MARSGPPRWAESPERATLLALYAEVDALVAGWSCTCSGAGTGEAPRARCCHFAVTGREPYPTAVELEELRHGIRVAGLPVAAVLDSPVAHGENLVSVTSPRIDDLRQASTALAAGITTVIRELEPSDKQLRSDLRRTVAVATKDRIAFERSWYAPLGIDPNRDEVPELQVLLDSLRQA